MVGANQFRIPGSKRVNINICGQIPSFVCSGTMVIELREFNNKKKKKNTIDKMYPSARMRSEGYCTWSVCLCVCVCVCVSMTILAV